MELSDKEREEFTRLADATLDPDLWDEADLPILRAARAEHEREQALACADGVHAATEDDNLDDDGTMPDDPHTADGSP
jgi:hypothetical protein